MSATAAAALAAISGLALGAAATLLWRVSGSGGPSTPRFPDRFDLQARLAGLGPRV
ncbi:hypothetical protein [Egibacter rhizosphaerae]|uniref:hypothetical protein n=1 Tax=Egibacter rhizosphaerae TaxID=1670831 RepID=UPI0013F17D29|nr:hypothetical protein [Egibacter rhizosphaerae]